VTPVDTASLAALIAVGAQLAAISFWAGKIGTRLEGLERGVREERESVRLTLKEISTSLRGLSDFVLQRVSIDPDHTPPASPAQHWPYGRDSIAIR